LHRATNVEAGAPLQSKLRCVPAVADQMLRDAERHAQLALLQRANDVAKTERSEDVHTVLLEVMSEMLIRERLAARAARRTTRG
jgi:hypothetical protein